MMELFYASLWKDGLDPEQALAQAQTAFLRRDREAGRFRPSAWGAWVLTK